MASMARRSTANATWPWGVGGLVTSSKRAIQPNHSLESVNVCNMNISKTKKKSQDSVPTSPRRFRLNSPPSHWNCEGGELKPPNLPKMMCRQNPKKNQILC